MIRLLDLLWRYGRAFGLIWACLFAGNTVAGWLPITLPGSILGMLLLFALLCLQLVPVAWVRPGSLLFIRYMVLLFVPISVGVMVHMDMLIAQFGPIVVSCVVSTLLVMIVTGFSAEYLRKPGSGGQDE
ncbi:CidA/LrgA family protein [Pantoea sp. 1.19]|uniref:CidA/LrgA family protein n=1 Tax=Pantoea sp. 1.19 TaxID=1925589 RepID=UPI0009489210|nr:CidA/LrgA family protein [Pantoea sp. 1.19]